MAEKPIIFNTAMVRAIVAGVKTQTRRPTAKQQYEVGDLLWVRETFSNIQEEYKGIVNVIYKADFVGKVNPFNPVKWSPSIHMPKKYARTWLCVKSAHLEQLQSITEDGMLNEGVRKLTKDNTVYKYAIYDHFDYSSVPWSDMPRAPIEVFRSTWDAIYAERGLGWDKNPFVWVYKFRRVRL